MLTCAYKRYVLVMLTSVYMLNQVDRGLMMLLLQPIKEDLRLSDTQLGLMTGIAFGLFYAVVGIPMARWADRGNRVNIAALSIGLWSLTVMVCLFVTGYVQMLFARVMAAVGEAGCKPPTYSLVGDYFPMSRERTRAMAVYVAGIPISSLVSFVIGGWLNERYGWRMTFFIMGIGGLVLAPIVRWTVREPRLRVVKDKFTPTATAMTQLLQVLWKQHSLRHLTLALIVLYAMSLGLGPWYAALLMRRFAMGTAELGVWLGLILGLSGIVGALLGGFAASHWFGDNEGAQMRWSAVAVASLVVFYVAFLTLPQKHLALVALIPLFLVFNCFFGPTYALMQRLVPDEMRATMMSVVMLLANVIGFGVGPQIVGILSDQLVPLAGKDALRFAMLIVSFLGVWSGFHFWQVAKTVNADLLRVKVSVRVGD